LPAFDFDGWLNFTPSAREKNPCAFLQNFFASAVGKTYSQDVATAGRVGGTTEKMGSSTLPQLNCRKPVATA